MLHLAVFTFVLCSVHVVMGVDLLYPFLPFKNVEGQIDYLDSDAGEPIASDTEPFPPQDTVEDEDKFPSFFQNYSKTSQYTEWSSRICKKDPQLVEHFASTFMERVMSYKKFRKAFQPRGFSAISLSSFYYNLVFEGHVSVGCQDPQGSAQVVAEAVADNFHKLKKNSLLRTYAESMGHILFYRGFLKSDNVASLSQRYFMLTERNINTVENPTPVANIKAVSAAFAEFLNSLGFFNQHTTFMIAATVASRWYAL